ncbi:MAG: hypothetical protein U0269_24630 [Polyangiales bacterium]
MKVVLFGATGMIGQGVLRECLLADDVESVLSVSRAPTGKSHAKLRELIHKDFADFSAIEPELAGYDACFFCLGISSAGMSEADYTRITYDYALAAAKALVKINPAMTFAYVSGQGTDSTEKSRTMWARVKGRTENALLALPFARVAMFRPGYIQPMHGATSKTALYRAFYAVLWPLYYVVRAVASGAVTNTEAVGLAMLALARGRTEQRILDNAAINALAAEPSR